MELQKKATRQRRDAVEEAKRRKADDETNKRQIEMAKQKVFILQLLRFVAIYC
jgi:hypothetical protein